MDQYIGEIRLFAGNYAPLGWALCDGQRLPIHEYEMLFSLIGTVYGGDGQTTFALPDLRGRAPIHTSADLPAGIAGGVEKVALKPAQFPAHSHAFAVSTARGDASKPAGGVLAATGELKLYREAPPSIPMHQGSIGAPVGPYGRPYGSPSPQPHENMQPYQCINYIIALEGLYPPRD